MLDDLFNKTKETEEFENELNYEVGEGEGLDLRLPIPKPNDFDDLKSLINYYEDMEMVIESLGKEQCVLRVDEDPDDKDSEWYNLDQEYIDLFVNILECKMKEIRNILNYN